MAAIMKPGLMLLSSGPFLEDILAIYFGIAILTVGCVYAIYRTLTAIQDRRGLGFALKVSPPVVLFWLAIFAGMYWIFLRFIQV